ncbi:ABC transporter substrate-binding protein [Comamonas jiangduensis]|uniref:ABC transporter substrate-binding protein n=1 Tax=Comamonas jiangduensis TaxID=1194168 RepID=UPI0028AB62A7|nr:ABC transporter substrate-binding protein [Comamonas jiangduensis]
MQLRWTLPVLAMAALPAWAAPGVLKIGEINSYKAMPAFLEPYKKGMDLAVEQINAQGGLLGKQVVLVTRDDNGNPGDAVRAAEELYTREKIDVLTGSFLSHVGMALTDYAGQKKRFFLASETLTDKVVWQNGNRYTYRLRGSTYMQTAMLVQEAKKLNKKRWAIVYPNYEYGQSAVATFKQLMKEAQPDIEFVAEQAPALGKIDAGSVVQAIADAKPDVIFNVLFSVDLGKFVREGNTRGLFKDRTVVGLLSGEPEYLDALRQEAPEGWIVTGYPWYSIKTPAHDAFLKAYQGKFKDYPRLGTIVGYNAIQSLAAGITKAGSTDTEALIKAFKGLNVNTPWGPITYRAQDNQSTMGAYVGTTTYSKELQRGIMTNFYYADGKDFQPTDAEVKKLRPASAQ